MARERLLDVSQLPPPQPLEEALDVLERLQPGEYVRMLLGREPFPLYAILEQDGFAYRSRPGEEVPFEVLIWRAADAEAEQAVLQIA